MFVHCVVLLNIFSCLFLIPVSVGTLFFKSIRLQTAYSNSKKDIFYVFLILTNQLQHKSTFIILAFVAASCSLT